MNIQSKQNVSRFAEFHSEAIAAFVPAETMPKGVTLRKPKFLSAQRFWFALVVLLPVLITTVYFTVFASDQYLSLAEFVVRSQNKQAPTGLGSLLGGSGSGSGGLSMSNRSEDDTYAVQEYIMSRDVVRLLDQKNGLRDILNRPEADPLARFPRIASQNSFEKLYKAYSRFVDVTYDEVAGISTLSVTAFRPEDSRALAQAMLDYGEQLVNRLNERSEHDAMDLARSEVDSSEQRLSAIQLQIKNFRDQEVLLDPADNGKGLFELVSKLAESSALAKAQLSQLLKSSPNSPQIAPLKDQIAALESQIDKEQVKMAGTASSLAPKIAAYEELEMQKTFAAQDLEAAHQMLQTARIQASQQHLYLETIVKPDVADYALYPRRLVIIATVAGVSLLLYGIGWLMVAGAREHIH